jgi:hypothetical protein
MEVFGCEDIAFDNFNLVHPGTSSESHSIPGKDPHLIPILQQAGDQTAAYISSCTGDKDRFGDKRGFDHQGYYILPGFVPIQIFPLSNDKLVQN